MKEPQRLPLQGRYGADEALHQARAVLVSERHAVWTKPAAVQLEAGPLTAIGDPIWDHADGTRWTPDLVHCRLREAAETVSRLPGVHMRRFRSLMGKFADAERDPAEFVIQAPSPNQISVADWTFHEVFKRPHEARQILIGMAFEQGVRKIGAKLRISKSQISRDYMAERRYLAAHWQTRQTEPLAHVDVQTLERWRSLFENARK